jgi:hypothetical protein
VSVYYKGWNGGRGRSSIVFHDVQISCAAQVNVLVCRCCCWSVWLLLLLARI